jgi:hypothetical protein
MEILKKTMEKILLEITPDEMLVIHCALYQWKACLKYTKLLDKDKKRQKLARLNRMITLVDLLI